MKNLKHIENDDIEIVKPSNIIDVNTKNNNENENED